MKKESTGADPFYSRVVSMQEKGQLNEQVFHHKEKNYRKLAADWLDSTRDEERIQILKSYWKEDLVGLDLLEVGSGIGTFLITAARHGIKPHGLEPNEYAVGLSKERMQHLGEEADIHQGYGERMPFKNESFDIIVSFQVLEHTTDPKKVIEESWRVLRPGGVLYMITPNFQSFWEGHYGLFWIPRMPHWLAKIYVTVLGRDAKQVDDLRFIYPGWVKRVLDKFPNSRIITLGEDVWAGRMEKAEFDTWGYTRVLLRLVKVIKKLRLTGLAVWAGKIFRLYFPIIMMCEKEKAHE